MSNKRIAAIANRLTEEMTAKVGDDPKKDRKAMLALLKDARKATSDAWESLDEAMKKTMQSLREYAYLMDTGQATNVADAVKSFEKAKYEVAEIMLHKLDKVMGELK